MLLFEIIAWVLLGLVAGWLAKAAVPGPEPGGFVATTLIGIAGAVVGGFLFRLLGMGGASGFNFWSILVAFVGAVVFLFVWKAMTGSRRVA
jgi:uncharacterized membrane protein YeaQ/YmgE (transglycosylase-associated protein family)